MLKIIHLIILAKDRLGKVCTGDQDCMKKEEEGEDFPTRCQFHQRFTYKFFVRKLFRQLFF